MWHCGIMVTFLYPGVILLVAKLHTVAWQRDAQREELLP